MIKQFNELCKKRHSIRGFDERPIDDNIIQQILEVMQTAPSAGNLQAYEVIIVKNPEKRQQLAKAALGQKFVAQAPVVLAFNALPAVSAQRYGKRGAELYSVQDATIACTYAMLAATALGLSSTWVGAFDDNEVINILGVCTTAKPVALLPIGYGSKPPSYTTRKALHEISREL